MPKPEPEPEPKPKPKPNPGPNPGPNPNPNPKPNPKQVVVVTFILPLTIERAEGGGWHVAWNPDAVGATYLLSNHYVSILRRAESHVLTIQSLCVYSTPS